VPQLKPWDMFCEATQLRRIYGVGVGVKSKKEVLRMRNLSLYWRSSFNFLVKKMLNSWRLWVGCYGFIGMPLFMGKRLG
jgi:hypothetical protein